MPPFSRIDGIDWRLAQAGPVTVIADQGRYIETLVALAGLGYDIVSFDGARWTTKVVMLADLAEGLSFPEHFGYNLDALADCLTDLAYGDQPTVGTVIAIDRIDVLTAADERTANVALEILAETSRKAMLVGHRVLVIASSGDPAIR